ncbi:MAG: hypothetical protein ACI9XO_003940 [Paraglaciecola sp.]|jgi:hypothetical protein
MKNNMQNLLDKYFAGETTLQEETVLREYFNGNQVEKAHLKFKPLFQYFEKEQAEGLENNFDKKVVAKIGRKGKVLKMRSLRNRVLRIAAVFLILVSAWLVMKNTILSPEKTMEQRWAQHEIKDPEKAFEATKAALLFASMKFNRGTRKAAGGVVKIQKVSKYFKTKD